MDNDKYAVEMLNITKTFNNGAIVANDDLTLKVKKNHIHALVGENGAGKSTLMSILFGMYQPTSGEIKINGDPVIITDPIKANQYGIGMVHQHFKLVDVMKVWENIALGVEDTTMGMFTNAAKIKRKITKIMDQYGLYVDLNAKIEDISVGMQQRVEIIKILYRDADIIVFDEPTAVLTPKEIDNLLEIMENLKAKGKTIIFITHKLDEIKKVADEATVIRLGKNVKDFKVSELKGNELGEAMVGRKLVEVKNKNHDYSDKVVLNVINLTAKKESDKRINAVENLSLQVHEGEILAVAGVEGNGQKELIEAITGLTKPTTGAVVFNGINITNAPIKKRYEMGMSHIPEDRHKYGMIMDFNVLDNIVLQSVGDKPFARAGFSNKNEIDKYGRQIIKQYDVRGARNGMAVSSGLSGGNQQKFVVGREITRPHDLLVVVQPTRGLDIGAIEYIHSQILEEKNKNKAVLLVSYELGEVMSLADNIAVINDGKIVKVLPAATAKREEIGALMGGAGQED
ncbi:ABC transporter ATP-binding protein [Mesoplasma lactucae]|uniref:Sugar ABC transporter ATP-binding protein n=1 Tax=Mesoplasma lactucae ATCC 49193 TaxID=81460 RepID=A0A291ISC0_9MOLU|nr:ABC transporter ATP-binding protein [Mesoplasma lactucae]ATG97628.1 sugar ABC transporter ATP-binding protein [Mesoplasma lactucae ATCC 49193]ATZ19911.1 ribose/galactose ABC transporter ATP-binding protein [Mesoplasma lactucae ATCC 49193]MCL8216775.1 Galactose/methyl galactoside import ATP-binding protein MglA [Mesoplasma lactucae ATCC 49193]